MRILILGGTQFIGRYIAETLLAAGHAVTIFNRGQSPDPLPAAVERLVGDRDQGVAGLAALADRAWDVCVDVSGYTALQVRPSAELLRERVGRYLFISAVAVYGDTPDRPVTEEFPRVAPAAEDVTELDEETYGRLKVTCENIVQAIYGPRSTIFRPQTVVGPDDPSGRYSYWVQRARQAGPIMAPGDGTDHLQVIDVRDLARFAQLVIEGDLGGVFNLAGPRLAWAEFIGLLGIESPVWVPAEIILGAGLTFRELPLYRPEHGVRSSLMAVSNARALAAGLQLTAPEQSVRDVQRWLDNHVVDRMLAPELEAELIRQARSATR